jgi:hypothetical protein
MNRISQASCSRQVPKSFACLFERGRYVKFDYKNPMKFLKVSLERIKQARDKIKMIDKRSTKWSETGTSKEIPIFPGMMSTTQTLSKLWKGLTEIGWVWFITLLGGAYIRSSDTEKSVIYWERLGL